MKINNEADVLSQLAESNIKKLNIKKLREDAILPTRGTRFSAGLDLYSAESYHIDAQSNVMVQTGIAMEIPQGYVGLIFARSGLASKQNLRPANCVGVIDSDYRGEVCVCLYNDSATTTHEYTEQGYSYYNISPSASTQFVEKGQRVAQLVIVPYLSLDVNEVKELSDTDRSEGGFGSTGK